MNLRSKSKAKTKASPKTEPAEPTLSAPPDHVDLSEGALRKLPRAGLQKLAMAHKVKANQKSELIIRQLSSLHILSKEKRPAEDDHEEGPSRKRPKNEATLDENVTLRTPKKKRIHITPGQGKPGRPVNVEDTQPEPDQEREPSAPRTILPPPIRVPYDEDIFSGTESEATEEEQLDFATPISSRSGTPPPANVIDLERCVKIMREISEQDVVLLSEVKDVRETAAKLRKRARDVRELVKAENGRRERMEAYFRYWQETKPSWDRRWLYGEGPAARSPKLSREQVKQAREEIIARQEAEKRALEAQQISDMLGEGSCLARWS